MDMISEEAKVPLFNNRVFIKATRLEWKSTYSLINIDETKMGDLSANNT